jgi:hypothetical protein
VDNEQQLELIPEKIVELRLQFIHRSINKKWYSKNFPFLVQNEPFEYGLKIKNIGSEPFSGALIEEFAIKAGTLRQHALKAVKIKPLNPGEEYDLYIDKYTLWHEGSISTSCILVPDKSGEKIHTYQHHRDHDIDELYAKPNKWWHDYYCQSQQQLLQTRTNNLILLLTTVTVIEAIFGLKESLKFIAGIVAWSLSKVEWLFAWLAS